MQEIKFVLEDFEIDKDEIIRLLEEEDLITALRIIELKTNFNLKNSLSLMSAMYKKKSSFSIFPVGNKILRTKTSQLNAGIIPENLPELIVLKIVFTAMIDKDLELFLFLANLQN